MANVTIKWGLPAKRAGGKSNFDPASVKHVELQIASVPTSGETTFAALANVPPGQTEWPLQDVDPGEWAFRGRVIDVDPDIPAGAWANAGLVIADKSAPGLLEPFTVELA